MSSVDTSKTINPAQLDSELGNVGIRVIGGTWVPNGLGQVTVTGSKTIDVPAVDQTTLSNAINAHTAAAAPVAANSAFSAAVSAAVSVADLKTALQDWLTARSAQGLP